MNQFQKKLVKIGIVRMKIMSLSIAQRQLIFILPLICVPIIVVGYLSYNTSVERVSRLLKEEQTLKAKAVASKINDIFQACHSDLLTLSHWDLIYDYHASLASGDQARSDVLARDINELLRNFVIRSPFYNRINLIYNDSKRVITISKFEDHSPLVESAPDSLNTVSFGTMSSFQLSEINYSEVSKAYFITTGMPFESPDHRTQGIMLIEIDFSKLIDLVENIKVGEEGYAFLVDNLGRIIAHPKHAPYSYDFTQFEDTRLREFIVDMISGETGWKEFDMGEEVAAAFAPVHNVRWSVAVSIPIEEFKREANNLRLVVTQVVVVILGLSIVILLLLSRQIAKPIKSLVVASREVAKGDLLQEIPVTSGGELGMLTRSFNSMIRSVRDSQRKLIRSERLISIGKLSAGVAHEIRNPLNAMKGAVTHIKNRRCDDEIVSDFSQLILEEINRLSQFVEEFLRFAKMSLPKLSLNNINDLIENTINLFRNELMSKNVKIIRELKPDMPSIMFDMGQLEQVIINIIVNAIHAVHNGGIIIIQTSISASVLIGGKPTAGPMAQITVTDNGPGIEKEKLQKVFDLFYSTKEEGTGLGLPISLNIIENHGGTIQFTSEIDFGTEVTVSIPVENQIEEVGEQ